MSNPIWIPTFGREKVITLDQLTRRDRERTNLVVISKDEGERLTQGISANYVVCPVQGKGVHLVRDWIVQQCIKKEHEIVIMLDDDLKFHVCSGFSNEDKKIFKIASSLQVEQCITECEDKARRLAVGLTSFSQMFHNTTHFRWQENKDNASTYFHRTKLAVNHRLKYAIPSVDDRHFILSVLELGYVIYSNTYITSTKVGKHGDGGEAAVGDRGRRHEESLRLLADRYPRFVRLYTTTSESYVQNYGTSLAARFYYANMARYVQKGGNARDPR